MQGEIEQIVLSEKASKTSVVSTSVGGTAMRTPGYLRAIRRWCSRWRMKARPRAFPPSEPPPICRKNVSAGLKRRRIKFADQDLALLAAILGDRFDQVAPQMLSVPKSDTVRGRSFCASANSVRAISQCEKWLRSP